VEPMPYTEFQCMIDDPPGLRNYWTADYLHELTDEAIEVFVSHSERMPVPSVCFSIMFSWGGQVARASRDTSPMAQRDAQWVCHPYALWEGAARDAEHMAWARAISADLKRFAAGGIYLNFIGDEGQDRVRAAYGENYERLAAIKARYDPDNFFRLNHNIVPSVAATA
jgi:FAD/FMN-containing dehydrogenase